jgi:hypothetical protein
MCLLRANCDCLMPHMSAACHMSLFKCRKLLLLTNITEYCQICLLRAYYHKWQLIT